MLTRALTLVLICLPGTAPSAQQLVNKSGSAEAQLANQHYKKGWEAMRTEAWTEAAREFQAAIDIDARFTLAYYSLGRAEMGLKNFGKAITAYNSCKNLYLTTGGERYANQMAGMRSIDDRILELRTAIGSAQNSGGRSASQSTQLYIRDLQGQIDRLEQARQRNIELPNDGSVPYFVPMALGAAYFRSGRFADAEREYKEAIAANAASGETHNNLAVLYLTTGRYDEADSEVRAAEKVGFKVNENLKGDIRKKKAGGLP